MALYSYTAVRPNGETVEGEMEAADELSLVRQLQAEGYIPVKTEPAGKLRSSYLSLRPGSGKKLSHLQIALFTRELATLLESGLTLDRSLQILQELSDTPTMTNLLDTLKQQVQAGKPFSAALEQQKGLFSKLYISMVKAGEVGGVLQNVLNRLADYLDRSMELRESIRSALIYPTILLVVAGLSVALLLMFVVPQFSQMFQDMGQALPLATQIVIAAGELFQGYWWLMLSAVLLLTAYMKAHLAVPANRYRWDRRILKLPLVGELVAKVEAARFARTLSTLLENGLTLLTALKLVKDVISNRVIAEHVEYAVESLQQGKGLSQPLMEKEALPRLALQMIKVGEESGNLEGMLARVADVYDREVEASIKQMLTLLEPVLIVGLGLIVAGIIVSILVAILQANQLVF